MERSPWRFDVQVKDRKILEHFIEFRGYSYRQLAEKVSATAKTSGPSKATIGHLVSGHVKTTKKEWAMALETVLDVPRGSLFEATVSRVSKDAA